MIYESVDPTEPIRQGDIFRKLPKVEIALDDIALIEFRDQRFEVFASTLEELVAGGDNGPIASVVNIMLVEAIVISQDCDASRSEDISFAEIVPFTNFLRTPPKPQNWASTLTGRIDEQEKFLYLPADTSFGFEDRRAVDFRSLFELPRVDIVSLRKQRVGRLCDYASSHFREKLAHFFRRYAYDPWYPLTKEEFAEYSAKLKVGEPPAQPFPWQR